MQKKKSGILGFKNNNCYLYSNNSPQYCGL